MNTFLRLLWKATLTRDAVVKTSARFTLLNALARNCGFQLYNKNLAWPDNKEFQEVWRSFPASDGKVRDRKFVLFSMAQALSYLPGDTAECGVYDGGSSYLICRAGDCTGEREHHVFDSFEGLSAPAENDVPSDPTAYKWQANDLSVPLETVQSNLGSCKRVSYYRGWIPDRFHEVADREFSFVHIDVDLYEPTLASLEFFYPRMVAGGILLCDDYGFTTCPGARRACDEFFGDKIECRVVHLPTGQGFVVKSPPSAILSESLEHEGHGALRDDLTPNDTGRLRK